MDEIRILQWEDQMQDENDVILPLGMQNFIEHLSSGFLYKNFIGLSEVV